MERRVRETSAFVRFSVDSTDCGWILWSELIE